MAQHNDVENKNNNTTAQTNSSNKADDDNNNRSLTIISSWPSITTRLLQEGGSSAWHVLDSVMELSTGHSDFCQDLYKELDRASLWNKLLPARTQGDVQTDQILSLIQGMITTKTQEEGTALTTATTSTSSSSSSSSSVRGDKSLFLSREYRRRHDFAQHHACLHQLISTVSHTLQTKLSHCINFDWELTSVQLAVYPGDATSGYRRHCDRGQESCRDEKQQQQPPPSLSTTKTTKTVTQSAQRIITCVYYLTDHDWNLTLDGGCLRLFHGSTMTDVPPYRDRLVVFRSDGVEHQVLPSLRRPRTAITLWFYGRPIVDHQKKVQLHDSSPTSTPTPTPSINNNKEESSTTPSSSSDAAEGVTDVAVTSNDTTNITTITNQRVVTEEPTTEGNASMNHPTYPPKKPLDMEQMGPPPLSILQPTRTTSSSTGGGGGGGGEDNHTTPMTSIFVSIASYRDSETAPTIQSLFSMARYPNRVVVGLVLQLEEIEDAAIWDSITALDCYNPSNIRCIQIDSRHAVGPCYARALCQSLHRMEAEESYVLQIDSHMRFRSNWDEYLVHQLLETQTRIGHDKVVLTAYPVGYRLPNQIPNETRGTLLVPWKFDAANGLLRQRGRLLKETLSQQQQEATSTTTAVCIPCLLYAGGFNFAPARVLHDVPYDQNLHHLFFGEELNMAVRLYTHGYELFAPPESVCYHLWSRAHRPVQHQSQPNKSPPKEQQKRIRTRKQQSLSVVRNLLAGQSDLVGSHCGLGTVRTAAQFAAALQVNFETQTLTEGCENGGLSPEDFVESGTTSSKKMSFAPDSFETKVSTLDAKSQALIGGFLGLC